MNQCKKAIALVSVLLWGLGGFGQKNDYVWLSGYDSNAEHEDSIFGITKMDFNYAPRAISHDSLGMNIDKTNVSFSDDAGNLLFYCNGIYIANALDEVIENSDSLNTGYVTTVWDPTIQEYGYRTTQGILAFANVSNLNQYYLLHSWVDSFAPTGLNGKKVLLSLLDMSVNSARGEVLSKNQPVISDLLGTELSAIRNGNGRDWWLLVQKNNSNCFYRIQITAGGVNSSFDLTCGGDNTPQGYIGASCFSPDGSKYAYLSGYSGLNFFDFDRCSGLLSNPINLPLPDIADSGWLGMGVSFSPNNRFLYVSLTKQIYQLDLMAQNALASIDTIGIYDGTEPLALFNGMQLGPDGKIYISCGNGVAAYHVINYPDLQGTACDFEQHSIVLKTYGLGLPNFPNYRLGALTGSDCDTLTGLSEVARAQKESILKVFPNPTDDIVTVDYGFTNWSAQGTVSLEIVSELGQVVCRQPLPQYSGYQKIDVSGYATGIYIAYIKRNEQVIAAQKFAKE